jgi:hypothetical protein
MMRVSNVILTSLVLVLLAVPWAGADEIAEVTNDGDRLIFHPIVEFAKMQLTVTGPCAYEYTQAVNEGDLVFRLDETTIDGIYRFYLMRIEDINPDVIEALLRARQNNDPEVPKALCRDGKLPGPPLNQSAGFIVIDSTIVWDPDTPEDKSAVATKSGGIPAGGLSFDAPNVSVAKDHLIYDDLIVTGSACIGFDCANGESFGTDTIRLKEHKLRIDFDDTSYYSNYPRNDWQLTVNDSANGGLNKFSIDDVTNSRTPFTVEANARSHSLYVDDGGRIGSRTSTPSVELHTIDGDTPTLRLQQDGSSGFTPQTWDVAGNETNFFIRDVTNGSQLPFRIRPDAPTSSIYIDTDGDVGMGTSSPGADGLHISRSTGGAARMLKLTNDGGPYIELENTDTGESWFFNHEDASPNRFIISSSATSGPQLELTKTGDLEIQGSLVTGGGGTCDPGPCDATFTEYELESIEEHSAYMWDNNHLWGVGPTPEGAPINLSKKTTGILHELEKAHIYIEQLNSSAKSQQALIEQLNSTVKSQQALIEEFTHRLEALEHK